MIGTGVQYLNDNELFCNTTEISKNEFNSLDPAQIASVIFENMRKEQQIYLSEEEKLTLRLQQIEKDIKSLSAEMELRMKEAEEIKRRLENKQRQGQLMKIGITERGDVALDLSWTDKMRSVNGAVIIGKGYNDRFDNALLEFKDKVIYHATITGLGGTRLEPGVFPTDASIEHLKALIEKGFPADHVVVRIDPNEPFQIFSQLKVDGCKGSPFAQIDDYNLIIEKIIMDCVMLGIRRFRYSYLDLYGHVKKRINEAGIRTDINKFSHFQHQRIQKLFYDLEHEVTCLDEGNGNGWNRGWHAIVATRLILTSH